MGSELGFIAVSRRLRNCALIGSGEGENIKGLVGITGEILGDTKHMGTTRRVFYAP